MRYLVIAATAAEVAHLPAGLEVVVTGIGKTAAAVGTARALSNRPTDGLAVLNVGTAGALRDGLVGTFEPGAVLNHEMNADAIRSLGYDPEERLAVEGGDGTVLASGDLFVADPARRAELALVADLVDMEGYAVAYACRAFGVPVRLVKHVSDAADEGAMDWPTVVDHCARELGAHLAASL